ncbi:MAG: WXG100 family type VII secretion target [Anaerolineales bacterium]|nr:WXG100 family type VII secretion target [Anaerolineales bacterium]MCB9418164.1 WXG100 family type VII secretion target [Ardenticatenaceae bacterium]
MSGIVKVHSADVRAFASQLKQFHAELTGNSKRLQAQFRRLGDTWQDPQYAKFAQEFERTMRQLQQFQRQSEEVIPRLNKLAEYIDNVPRV